MRPASSPQQSAAESDKADPLPFLLSQLEDQRYRIEKTKERCWDAFKWSVSMNLVLATVIVVSQRSSKVLILVATISALLGAMLVSHFTQRIERLRAAERRLYRHLNNTVLDLTVITSTGWHSVRHPRNNDRFDMFCYWAGIIASLVPIISAALVAR